MQLTDFNRLRWVLAAISLHPRLRAELSRCPEHVTLTDSQRLIADRPAPASGEALWVVLWDGLSSLAEFRRATGVVTQSADLRFLWVGGLPELAEAWPAGSLPLYPPDWSAENGDESLAGRARGWLQPSFGATWAVSLRMVAQGCLRPMRNRRLAPDLHRQLQTGGCVVFCGLARPPHAVVRAFVAGSDLEAQADSLGALYEAAWSQGSAAVRPALARAYESLRRQPASTPTDLCARYAILAVIHRIGTLAALVEEGVELAVNEYGRSVHFDPYDTPAYGRNLYLDFGSTRGPDALYPRRVDLLLQRKPTVDLRLLPPGRRLADWLQDNDSGAMLATCQTHAASVRRAAGQLRQWRTIDVR